LQNVFRQSDITRHRESIGDRLSAPTTANRSKQRADNAGARNEQTRRSLMTEPAVTRRHFNRQSLLSFMAAAAATSDAAVASAQQRGAPAGSTRRDVIKQELPGEPPRDLILVEVTYGPGAASPPHVHANGVMAFIVSGAIASKVDDGSEQTYRAGDAWWEPPGAIHRVSRNASSTDPATLLAIYVASKGATASDLMKPI
jgi:quercetin dioxygenase-like cupin family protein